MVGCEEEGEGKVVDLGRSSRRHLQGDCRINWAFIEKEEEKK